ncbi:MAG: beta-mannanase [Actinobacteria bacterium]|nr:beta-mannanase [Actinomycetota bacterium]
MAVRALAGIALAALAGCIPAPPSPGPAAPLNGGSQQSAKPTLPAYNPSRLAHPPGGKYLGIESAGAPGSIAPVRRFAASLGRKPNLIGEYVAWKSPFDAAGVARAWSYGALTYLAWEPFRTNIRAIARGASDGYISQFAEAVRSLNLPIVLSFGHEMNGNWYPWGTARTTAAGFVAAWRHIHDLFSKAGATNVIWMWNPNIINPVPQVKLRPYYPGNAYVDWVGITGYFPSSGPTTYATLYQPTIREIHSFTSKPLLIAETSVETGPNEVPCLGQLVSSVTQHSDLLGFVWFDYAKDGIDWRVESRPILRSALAKDLAGVPLINVN